MFVPLQKNQERRDVPGSAPGWVPPRFRLLPPVGGGAGGSDWTAPPGSGSRPASRRSSSRTGDAGADAGAGIALLPFTLRRITSPAGNHREQTLNVIGRRARPTVGSVLTEPADGLAEDGPGGVVPQKAAALKLLIVKRPPEVNRFTTTAGNVSRVVFYVRRFLVSDGHRDINKLARRRSLVNVSIMDPAGGAMSRSAPVRPRLPGRRAVEFDANAEVASTTPDQLRQVGTR